MATTIEPLGDGDAVDRGAPTATFTYGVDPDGVITWASEGITRVLGWTLDEIVGAPAAGLVHPDDLARGMSERHALYENRSRATASIRALRRDGDYAWLSLESHADLDASGAVVGSTVSARALLHVDEMTPVLAEAESRYRMLALNTFDVVAHQVGGVLEWISPSVITLLGYSADELVGRPTLHLWHPDDRAAVEHLRDLAIGGTRGEGLFRLRHKDGHLVWLDVAAAPDGSATRLGLVVSLRDATARVQAEEELRTREAEYRLLAENAVDLVVRTDLDGYVAWVSPSSRRLLGHAPEELVGRSLAELMHPDDVAAREQVRVEVASGYSAEYLARYRHRDGHYVWLEISGGPAIDDSGAVVGIVGSARDATAEVAAREALEAREAEYRLLAENAVDVVVRSGVDGTLEWVSPSAERVLGWRPDELVGRHFAELLHPEDLAAIDADRPATAVGNPAVFLGRYRHKSAGWVWMGVTGGPIVDADGTVVGTVSSARDVTAQVEARRALEASEEMFRRVMAESSIGMAVVALDGTFLAANGALCRMVDRDEAWMLSHTTADVSQPVDATVSRNLISRMRAGADDVEPRVMRLRRSDGADVWVRRTAVLVRHEDGSPKYVVAQIEDLSAERAAQDQLAYQAFHDPLTGLRNRAWVIEMIEEEVRSTEPGHGVGLLFLDLDNMKVVNDSLGHDAGDTVILEMGRRIGRLLNPGTHLGRFGGDEFVVVVPRVGDPRVLERLADRLLVAIAAPIEVDGHRVVPAASIGLVLSRTGATAASLLRDADSALSRAKASGRARWHFFDERMHADAVARLTVEDELRRAVAEHELVVHYQPIVRLSDRRVVGHEALVRWQHPTRGLVPPLDFLPVAEESGLIVDVGHEVLDQVCAMLAARPDLPGPISVNKSPLQIARRGWRSRFVERVAHHGVDPRRLVIEVTETAVLALDDTAREDLEAVRALGIGIHVDDFGTGYSSISLLRDLPVTGLKLDASFTRRLTGGDEPADVLAAGLAGLASGLHLTSVAEGVETEEQSQILAAQGWTHGQGWLFGRPQPEPFLG